MKKILIVLTYILIFQNLKSQVIDTTYSFFPKIFKGLEISSNLNDTCIGSYCVQFNTDTTNNRLNVIVFNHSKKIEEGLYIVNSKKPLSKLVTDIRTGNVQEVIVKVQLSYVRNGYWNFYKKNIATQRYFDKGKVFAVAGSPRSPLPVSKQGK